MRLGIFIGLFLIADRLSLIAGEELDVSGMSGILAFIFLLCLVQDIVSIFKNGGV